MHFNQQMQAVRKQLCPWAAQVPGKGIRSRRHPGSTCTAPPGLVQGSAHVSATGSPKGGEEGAMLPCAGTGFVNELSLSPDAKKARTTLLCYRVV